MKVCPYPRISAHEGLSFSETSDMPDYKDDILIKNHKTALCVCLRARIDQPKKLSYNLCAQLTISRIKKQPKDSHTATINPDYSTNTIKLVLPRNSDQDLLFFSTKPIKLALPPQSELGPDRRSTPNR